MGRSYCGGISARGTSLLEDHEVGGRRVDVRNTKKASVAEEQSVKERERRGKSLGHPQVLLYPCKDRGFYPNSQGKSLESFMRAGVGILEHREQWVGQRWMCEASQEANPGKR